MITHGIDEFMDDFRRTWCGVILAPNDPRPADDEPVDCISCLVQHARRDARNSVVFGRIVSINSDGSAVVEVV